MNLSNNAWTTGQSSHDSDQWLPSCKVALLCTLKIFISICKVSYTFIHLREGNVFSCFWVRSSNEEGALEAHLGLDSLERFETGAREEVDGAGRYVSTVFYEHE